MPSSAIPIAYYTYAHAGLAAQTVELERSNAALQRFAEVVGVELREPLHTVAGLLDPGSGLGDLLDGLLAGVADALDGLLGGLLDFAVITALVQPITDALGGLTGAAPTQSA